MAYKSGGLYRYMSTLYCLFCRESARKTRNIVAFRDGERHFANDAYNTVRDSVLLLSLSACMFKAVVH